MSMENSARRFTNATVHNSHRRPVRELQFSHVVLLRKPESSSEDQ